MATRRIFGICGYKGVGKDTLGRAILRHLSARRSPEYAVAGLPRQVNFADPLREVVATVFGLTPSELSDPALKEKNLTRWPFTTPRYLLQKVGTECFRREFPGVWVHAWQRRIGTECDIVTTDYRFLDEADALIRSGAVMIRVDRLGCGADGHESESYIERLPHNIVIYNSQPDAESFGRAGVRELVDNGFLPE